MTFHPYAPPHAMRPPEISVVLPVHNEMAALPHVVERIVTALAGESHELVLVDDGSVDESWRVITQLRERHPQVVALRFTRNFGHQPAILAGLEASRGAAVIMMDSDGQHPPELLPTLIARWRAGFPVVQGIRTGEAGAGPIKRGTSRLFYRVFTALAGVRVPPGAADFRLLARPVVDRVLASAGPLLFLRGLIPWMGFPTETVRFTVEDRIAGASSYSVRRMMQLSIHGLLGFSINPLRLASALGFAIALFAFAYLAYVIGVWFVSGEVVPGWASTAGLLAFLGGVQLLTLGIVGEYLGRVFMAQLGRPSYIVSERISGAGDQGGRDAPTSPRASVGQP